MISVITKLFLKGVDSRQMAYLKMGFVKKDPQGKGTMALSDFMGVLKSTLKSVKDEKETFDCIIQYSRKKKQDDSAQGEE